MRLDISTVEGSLKTLGCYVYTEKKQSKADPRFAMTNEKKFLVGLQGAGYALYTLTKLVITVSSRAFYRLCEDHQKVAELDKKLKIQTSFLEIYSLIAGLNQREGLSILPIVLLHRNARSEKFNIKEALKDMLPSGFNLLSGMVDEIIQTPSENLMLVYGTCKVLEWINNNRPFILDEKYGSNCNAT